MFASADRSRGSLGRILTIAVVSLTTLANLVACSDSGSNGSKSATTTADNRPRHSTGVDGTIVAGIDNHLWVASPDDRSVSVIDSGDLRSIRRIDTNATPARLVTHGSTVIASFSDAGFLRIVSEERATPIDLPCASGNGLTTWAIADRSFAAVACPVDGRVAIVDLTSMNAIGFLPTPQQPVAVSISTTALTVATSTGHYRTWKLATLRSALDKVKPAAHPEQLDVASSDAKVWRLKGRSASSLNTLVPGPDGPIAAYQVVDNERAADPTDPADTGSYANIINGNARIEPAVSSWCPHLVADFSRERSFLSGPSALAVDAAHNRLWIAGRFTGNVMVVDCAANPMKSGRPPIVAEFEIGVGVSGLVLSNDATTAWVDSAFDHAVVRIDLPSDSSHRFAIQPAQQRIRDMGASTLTSDAEQGRRLFNDATNKHLTPTGVVTCASCHPSGGDDGLSWRISTASIPRKYRRTPALWQLDLSLPLHWDGSFESLDDLTATTVHELLAGDGLLVETSTIADWLEQIDTPPAPISTHANPAVERGQALFESTSTGCSTCHSGPSHSDGKRHAVLGASEEPDGDLAMSRTPRLTRLAARGPYLHDGRAGSLKDVLINNPDDRHGTTSGLTDRQVDDLVAYLSSL